MYNQQTIICDIESNRDGALDIPDKEGNSQIEFNDTDFDSKVETFLKSMEETGQVLIAIDKYVSEKYLTAIISYVSKEDYEKARMEALKLQNQKIVPAGLRT